MRQLGTFLLLNVMLAGCDSNSPSSDASSNAAPDAWSADAATSPDIDAAPLPPCPAALPTDGSACASAEEGLSCRFTRRSDCGDEPVNAMCLTEGGTRAWRVPPSACRPDCRALAAQPACEQNTSCRWIVYGCEDGTEVWPVGCYPALDCSGPLDCSAGEACTEVIIQRAPDADPKVCGSFARICVAS